MKLKSAQNLLPLLFLLSVSVDLLVAQFECSGQLEKSARDKEKATINNAKKLELIKLIKEANFLIDHFRSEEAVPILEKASKIDANDPGLIHSFIVAKHNLQDLSAEAYYREKLYKINPNDFSNLGRMAEVYRLLQGQSALDKFEKTRLARLSTNQEKAQYYLSRAYSCNGLPELREEGFRLVKLAISLDPNSARAHFVLGDAYARIRQFELAISEFKKSIKLETAKTARAQALGALATSYITLGQVENAIPVLSRIIDESPNAEAYRERGNCYQIQGKIQDAMSDYENSLKLDPSELKTYVYKGCLFRCLHQNESALKELNYALSLVSEKIINPTTTKCYLVRGLLLTEMKRYGQAESDFTNVLKARDENMPAAYFARAKVRKLQGKTEMADVDLRTGRLLVEQLSFLDLSMSSSGEKTKNGK